MKENKKVNESVLIVCFIVVLGFFTALLLKITEREKCFNDELRSFGGQVSPTSTHFSRSFCVRLSLSLLSALCTTDY